MIDALHDEYLHGCDNEFVTGPAHPDPLIAALMRQPPFVDELPHRRLIGRAMPAFFALDASEKRLGQVRVHASIR